MFRKAKTQATISLVLGFITWLVPAGIFFALGAVIFGLIGLWRNTSKDKYVTVASLVGIVLGVSARFFASAAIDDPNASLYNLAIAAAAALLVFLAFYKKKLI